ncbi:hypothetical protein, partial [Frigidibacter sp. SD6-1]|uniref:hypothetical protein n=1 Tax=Frigidibacter sp. SD6-1 TaxID=3032581 RepID=UPI0024E008B9
MIAVKTIDDLLAEIESSTVEEASRISGYVAHYIEEPRDIKTIAERLLVVHGGGNQNIAFQCAWLFKMAGDEGGRRNILARLSQSGHAPAIHILGCIKREEGLDSEALDMFEKSKDLGYLIAAAAYYKMLSLRARWPKRWYYWWRYKWSWNEAQYEKKVRGLPDLSSTW